MHPGTLLIVIDFTGTTNGTGSILAFTTPGDHPQLASSNFSSTSTVNRYWTLTNNGVTGFSSFDATFTFLPGDADPGTNPNIFVVGNYNASAWNYPNIGLENCHFHTGNRLKYFWRFSDRTVLEQHTGVLLPVTGN